jgi:hypothetical protein
MCHKDHLVAALGTMSWPKTMTKMLGWAGFLCTGPALRSISWPELRVWDASSDRNCRAVPQEGHRIVFVSCSSLKLATGALLLDGRRQKQVQCGWEPSDGRAEVEP